MMRLPFGLRLLTPAQLDAECSRRLGGRIVTAFKGTPDEKLRADLEAAKRQIAELEHIGEVHRRTIARQGAELDETRPAAIELKQLKLANPPDDLKDLGAVLKATDGEKATVIKFRQLKGRVRSFMLEVDAVYRALDMLGKQNVVTKEDLSKVRNLRDQLLEVRGSLVERETI